MDRKYGGSHGVRILGGGEDRLWIRTPGMNLQIGEEILFEIIRLRHFGLILCLGD